jgi:hypothetical protein
MTLRQALLTAGRPTAHEKIHLRLLRSRPDRVQRHPVEWDPTVNTACLDLNRRTGLPMQKHAIFARQSSN